MALRAEGTASGWFHRAAITSRSLQWKDNEPAPLGSNKQMRLSLTIAMHRHQFIRKEAVFIFVGNFDLPLTLYKASSNIIYVNRLWSKPDMKTERKRNGIYMLKHHEEQELLKLASPPVEILSARSTFSTATTGLLPPMISSSAHCH
ncbi:UNVERIFIED_CONTAM: hypothetical protein Sindi_0135800 [Sesamum indicum]